jgi:hypothetical protein
MRWWMLRFSDGAAMLQLPSKAVWVFVFRLLAFACCGVVPVSGDDSSVPIGDVGEPQTKRKHNLAV